MSNKKIIAILVGNSNYQSLINFNNLLYEEILKEFKELYIIDFQNLIFFKKKKINKKAHFIIKNIKIFRPNSALEFINFFEKKKLIAFNNLGKGFSTFRIYYILNKVNLTQILLLNLGFLSNTVEIKKKNIKIFFSSLYFFFNRKIARYVFKFLTIIDIFPKYDYYLDSSKHIIRNMNSSFIRKIERLCPKIKISFFRKAININSRSYDGLSDKKYSNEKKYLVFVDSFFEHKDRVIREGSIEKKKNY